MKNRNLIYSFVVAWMVSIFSLMTAGLILDNRSLPSNIADYVPGLLLFVVYSFAVIAVAWAIVAVPYFFAAKRFPVLQNRIVGGLLASALGFGLMLVLIGYLPIDQKQWPIFCTIATLAGFLGSLVLLRKSKLHEGLHSE